MHDHPAPPPADLLDAYARSLAGKAAGTIDAYVRAVQRLTIWVAQRPGSGGVFHPRQLTRTAIEIYLAELEDAGYSSSHRTRVKAAASRFAQWLIEEHGLLLRNPTRGITIPPQPLLAPRELSPEQRYVLRNLVERADDRRGAALFALGYWAGCRVSDVAWLRMEHAHVGPKIGWLHVGFKGGKGRDIDLVNAARQPLHTYLQRGGREPDSPFVFTSQRTDRLTEAGIHHWFRSLKTYATKDEWELIRSVAFHDLRHDFAHRARAVGWTIEELAYYLGHVTRQGAPAIQTTARYTQVSRAHLKEKLHRLTG